MALSASRSAPDGIAQTLAHFEPAWAERSAIWRKQLARLLDFDTAVLAVLDPARPIIDAFLLNDGLPHTRLSRWCQTPCQKDRLLHEAVRRGLYESSEREASLLSGRTMAAALPAGQHTWWWLALSRRGKPFDETEQHVLSALLRTIASRFDVAHEPRFGRLLLDHDQQLLHADPITSLRFMQQSHLLKQLQLTLLPVIEQRWKRLAGYQMRSVFIPLGDQPTWVRFRGSGAGKNGCCHWYLELRPLESADPPAVGLVNDERVAIALGYLTDRYADAPVLAQIARYVDTSPFHFHRLFTRQVGVSPKHFLLRTQLLHAKHLLRTSRMPIGDVAHHSGFASHGHFTATFNRLVGRNPTDYREQV